MEQNKNYINWVVLKTLPAMEIDEKDKNILAILASDSRTPLGKISKKLKISKVAVFKRIKKLEKQGVITGYSCFIDFQKIGFDVYNVGIKTKMSHEEKKDYINILLKMPFLSQILSLSGGKWDFLIRFYSKRGEVKKQLEFIENPRVEKIDLIQTSNFFFEDSLNNKIIESTSSDLKLDRKDLAIVHGLVRDSSQSIVELAEKIKLSPKQVILRIKKLKQSGVILLLSALTNPLLYGGRGYLLEIETNYREEKKIMGALIGNKNSTGGMINLQNPSIISVHIINDLKELEKIESSFLEYRNNIKSWNFTRIDEQIYYNFFPEALGEHL